MLTIFRLETRNVRAGFDLHRRQLLRQLNERLRVNDAAGLSTLTLSYVLLYCAWSEAQFMQILHTPNAFHESKIIAIKSRKDSSGFAAAWQDFVDECFSRVDAIESNVAKQRAFITSIVKDYIEEPAVIRNKVAHGQWAVALNREHTGENASITGKICTLEFTQVDLWFRVQHTLGKIVRDLLQSPARTHFRDFWKHQAEIAALLNDKENWTLEEKRKLLREKPARQST